MQALLALPPREGRPRPLPFFGLREHKSLPLAFPERELAPHAASLPPLERDRRRERERGVGGVCGGEERPLLADGDVMVAAGVVEGWAALHLETHRPAHHPHVAHQARAGARPGEDRHKVDDLGHPLGGEEAREQDVGVGQVELLAALVRDGPEPEASALLVVQDGAEDRRRVERRQAEPVDRPVHPDERRRVEVADDTVVGYGKVAH